MDFKRKKKESNDPLVKEIISLRDSFGKSPEEKEAAGMACKGMYKCSKLADRPCLDRIINSLKQLHLSKGNGAANADAKPKPLKAAKAVGGKKRSRSKSRGRAKSKTGGRKRSRSRK